MRGVIAIENMSLLSYNINAKDASGLGDFENVFRRYEQCMWLIRRHCKPPSGSHMNVKILVYDVLIIWKQSKNYYIFIFEILHDVISLFSLEIESIRGPIAHSL